MQPGHADAALHSIPSSAPATASAEFKPECHILKPRCVERKASKSFDIKPLKDNDFEGSEGFEGSHPDIHARRRPDADAVDDHKLRRPHFEYEPVLAARARHTAKTRQK